MTITVPTNVKVSENVFIIVNMPKDAFSNVTIIVDGKDYNTIIYGGIASVTISYLTVGEHEVIAKFNGDMKYNNKTITKSTFKVINNDEKISDYNMTITLPTGVKVGENTKIIVNVPINANGKVIINVDGKDYNTIVYDGIACVNVLN